MGRFHNGCVCGTDLPGTCPGRYNCPYSGDELPDLDDCDEDDIDLPEDDE